MKKRDRSFAMFCVMVLFFGLNQQPTLADYRTWTGRNGVAIEAELVGVSDDGGVAALRNRDGRVTQGVISNLSDEDQVFITNYEKEQKRKGMVKSQGKWMTPGEVTTVDKEKQEKAYVAKADEAPRYAVVRIVNYDKSTTNLVMSAAEWQTLKAELQAETPLFGRALLAASNEWKADEVHRKQKFPSTAFGPRQATVIGPLYDSDQKASAALKLLPANSPLMESRRKQPKAQSETDNITAQALDLLVEQLDDMKGPSQSGESAEVSTNKIALTAGQVLSRTTAGTSQTTYHIAVPDNFNPEKPPPLLVVFSPGGDGRGMMNQVRASANTVGWMVIGCDKLKNGMSDEDAFPIERDLIRDFRTLIPYDQTRLYYGGFSGGASRAYHLTYRFKDPCAGILAFGGWLGGVEEQKKRFQKNMAIAMVNGDTDPGACSWEEADKTALKRRRCEVKIFHFPGGHAVAPSKVIDEAIAWLDTQAGTIGSKSKLPGK